MADKDLVHLKMKKGKGTKGIQYMPKGKSKAKIDYMGGKKTSGKKIAALPKK